MANNTNTLGGLTAENKTFYERTLLSRLLPKLTFAKYGQKKTVNKNEGNTVNFRRFESLPAATTALTEGVTPAGSQITVTPVEAQLKQYGGFVEISDVLDMAGIDPLATENAEILGEQAGLTIDTVVRNTVCDGATAIHYAGGGTSATANISATEVQKAVRTLRANNAKPMSDGSYIGIIDPYIAYDIMNDSLWQDVSKYSGGVKIMDGEVGKLAGVRFIQTTNTKVVGEGKDAVHSAVIIGQDAYGVVDLEGMGAGKPEIIIKPLGSGGTNDPLNQRGTQGWKAMFAAAILNPLAYVRLDCKVSQ